MKTIFNMMVLFSLAGALSSVCAENLAVNGNFDNPTDPLTGWTYDYAWTKHSSYSSNATRVRPKASEAGKSKVLEILAMPNAGTKVESVLIPFDSASRYLANLDVKGKNIRIYFAGYKWKPGIRPHDDPKPEEMRMVYRGQAITPSSSSWQQVNLSVPGEKASPLSLKHLKQIRFITLYVWSEHNIFVDNVEITKLK